MSNKKNSENVSSQTIDMLVDSTLKKHGVNLDPERIGTKEKDELKNIVNSLMKSVNELNQDKKETKE